MRRVAAIVALVAATIAGYVAGRAGLGDRASERVPVDEAPAGGLATPEPIDLPELPDAPVRNLILAVGDGLGVSELAAARLRAFGGEGRFVMERLPVTALVATAPRGRWTAKSDSAATALATGVRTNVGSLSVGTDGAALPTLVEAAAARGVAVGLVTTSQVFDATPAAFYAHVERRHDYTHILDQLEGAPVDLVAGGGREQFDAGRLDGARARGVTVVEGVDALARADRLPLWALFPGKRLGEEPPEPTLDALAERALALLAAEGARRGGGFFLLLEEEGIDTAAHDNDLDRMTRAAVRFDRAVARAARFAAEDGATLLVVVGDHATGGVVVEDGTAPGAVRVKWGTNGHTAEPVALYAYGPAGASRAFGGALDLADVGARLREALGVEPSPPTAISSDLEER